MDGLGSAKIHMPILIRTYWLEFPFSKVRDGIDNDPWYAAAEVYNLRNGAEKSVKKFGPT